MKNDDIVTRLRRVYVQNTVADLCGEAADEIERLRKEIERLSRAPHVKTGTIETVRHD